MVSLGEDHTDEYQRAFNAKVDDRIDRKFDRFKLWIAGAVIANLIPILGMSAWAGATLAQVQAEIRMMSGSLPQTVTRTEFDMMRQDLMRRTGENADRIKELERKQ